MKTHNALLLVALLTTSIQTAFALDAPEPFEPNDGEVFDLNTAANFSWNKVTGATKYQLVFATDEKFSSFDEKKNKCSNVKTCATFTISKISYKLAKTHAFMKKDGSYFWKVRAYQGRTKGTYSDVYQFHVGEPPEEVTSNVSTPLPVIGTKNFGYTKIANDGSELPDEAKLGANPTDWACTKDNVIGLVWEVKTTDGGLRDWKNTYTNYDLVYPKCDSCVQYTGIFGASTNSDGFVSAVNKKGLCGAKDWRLPANEELRSLVYCSDEKYTNLGKDESGFICESNDVSVLNTKSPTINATFFPNTKASAFWSSASIVGNNSYAWQVAFYYGYSSIFDKYESLYVRLVRGRQ